MASPRQRGPRPGAILRASGRLVLLIGFGFGVGLVIGLISEEPALVYGHLRGEGETLPIVDSGLESSSIIGSPIALTNEPGVAADEGSSAAGRLPEVVDAELQAKRLALRGGSPDSTGPPNVAAPARVRAPVRKIENTRVVVSKPVPDVDDSPRWAIQVGAFSEEGTARRLVKSLEAKSYPVAVLPSNGTNQRWRVRVQPLRGEQGARELANRLKREEGLPTWVIRMEADSR